MKKPMKVVPKSATGALALGTATAAPRLLSCAPEPGLWASGVTRHAALETKRLHTTGDQLNR
jgi:hypothetical protein